MDISVLLATGQRHPARVEGAEDGEQRADGVERAAKQAVAWDVIERMPCSIQLLPVVRREAAFFDFDDYERLVDAARSIDWRTQLIVLLGGDGGLRVGEIVALQWDDVDFGRGQLCVRHSDWRGQLTSPKNGRVRFVGMTQRLAVELRSARHLRSPRVLYQDDGRPLTRQGAWSRVRYAARRANLRTGVHILRHTFCSHLVMQGARMRDVQELVGHQDLTMTQRYSHLTPAALSRRFGYSIGGRRFDRVETVWRRPRAVDRKVKSIERVKWLGGRDSNPDNGVQSAVSYR